MINACNRASSIALRVVGVGNSELSQEEVIMDSGEFLILKETVVKLPWTNKEPFIQMKARLKLSKSMQKMIM